MSGITHVLNIAKQALLAHQTSVQVGSHNIANVDTPGYTRQSLRLGANNATPLPVGNIGGGVNAETIFRNYDRFMTERIASQHSVLSNLESQKDSLRIVETIFNEAQGFGLNDVMSQFWNSWQDLSDNPEILSTRQTVVQMGQLVIDQVQYMNDEIAQARYDIGVNLEAATEEINSITDQLSAINLQIINMESANREANDLRDRRDELVKELSGFLDVKYYENRTGAYTVLLKDGHPLVDNIEKWDVEMLDNSLRWLSTNSRGVTTSTEVGTGADLGGKVGGWLEVRSQLLENDPNNYLGRLNAFTNSLIREVNQVHSQGVGLVSFENAVVGQEIARNTAFLTTTVDATTAIDSINSGTLEINDRKVGEIRGALPVNGLAMAKTYNAVTAINDAITGVTAKMTTQVAGSAVTPMVAGDNGNTVNFTVNGVDVSYAVTVPGDDVANTLATNVVAAINTAISTYNGLSTTANPVTIEAVVGDGANGGAADSIVLRNTNSGDESPIGLSGLDLTDATEVKLGLADGKYMADNTHNTGEISLFSQEPFEVKASNDDYYLNQLGMGGGLHSGDSADDGRFTFDFSNGGIAASLQGYDFADELVTDGGAFEVWVYNTDGTLALSQPVEVSLDRASTLQDVVNSFNVSLTNASGGAAWLTASIEDNKFKITPDTGHTFALGNDSSNFLQVAGVNTYFSGHDSSDIGLNQDLVANLDLVAAAKVNEHGEIFRGDNSNALLVSAVQDMENVEYIGTHSTAKLDDFYNALVSEIGTDTRNINRDYEYNSLVSNQMQELRDAVSGVSLDEEMANLIKYQQAYTAAAKLVGTSDEMLVTLLETVKR